MPTRRNFLTTSAAVLGGLGMRTQPLAALSRRQRTCSPREWLPPEMGDDTMRSLARLAMEEATRHGATYADIRLGETQGLSLRQLMGTVLEPGLNIGAERQYGIRVLVDGVWGFAGGGLLTREHIAAAARQAVAHARHHAHAFASYKLDRVELAPHTPQTGEWTTPVHIDPFTVPLVEHAEVIGAWSYAMSRSYGGSGNASLQWSVQTRVFGSSEGALLVQRLYRSFPTIQYGFMGPTMPNFGLTSGGFETITEPTVVDRAKAFIEDVVSLERLPYSTTIDVGKYPVVFDGRATAAHVDMLTRALESDRVLGTEGDASGTSFLTPPEDILRATAPLLSPLVTVAATPTATAFSSLKWDDEGVPLTAYPLIRDGRVVHYTTTRETALQIPDTNTPMLRGGLIASDGELDNVPVVCVPEVTMTAAPQGPTFRDLVRDLREGVVVRMEYGVNPDTTLATAMSGGEYMYHVKGGAIIGKLPRNSYFLTRTSKLWNEQVVTVGGPSTVEYTGASGTKGIPWHSLSRLVTAPAVLLKDIHVAQLPS